jgi:hypothetical protein
MKLVLFSHQPLVLFSHAKLASAISHRPASGIFLSQQISTSHQQPASQTGRKMHPILGKMVNLVLLVVFFFSA